MRTSTGLVTLVERLASSYARVLDAAGSGRIGPQALRRLADSEAIAAFNLQPRPIDPAAHVRAGHAFMRPHLERLAWHEPTAAVAITSDDGFTYTFRPRTVLRRVLDHALDHLNQIEQWVAWQTSGAIPTPTEGWASSEDSLEEDVLPLSTADLRAWLWRIDLAWTLLARRAAQLSPEQLDRLPPGDAWSLRQTLHHVASGFYAAWLDDPLPAEALARYAEANRRLQAQARSAVEQPLPPDQAFYGHFASPVTLDSVVGAALAAEDELLGVAAHC